jgi:GR25 family glycosyltransferase involved in LPS biosynthesis
MKIPIFVINLKKDKVRKQLMINQFIKFNIQNYIFIDAIDGTDYYENGLNVKPMQNWIDPIFNRGINNGEIGCMLSHYQLWSKIVADGLNAAIILEDDNIFDDKFIMKLYYILEINFNLYDLFYLSRYKQYLNIIESHITDDIVIPSYSYNANAYIITYKGANKLLNAPIIQNLIPVDEFLPIMYDCNYPYKQYQNVFANCDKLIALALVNDISDQISRDIIPSNILNSSIYNPN